jgi:hypothetical protein
VEKSLFRQEQGMVFKPLKTLKNFDPKITQKGHFPENSL